MPKKVSVTLLVLAAVWLASTSRAQMPGRISLTLLDAAGTPVAGARVVVTRPDYPRFRQEHESNKKGSVFLAFPDATGEYRLEIEKEGFFPVDTIVEPVPGELLRRQMQLQPVGAEVAVPAEADAGTRSAVAEELTAGIEALREGDLERAEELILQVLEKDDSLEAAHSALTGLYLRQGRYEQAIAGAKRLLVLNSGNPRGYRALYEAHKALGQEREAAEALAMLSEMDRSGETVNLLYNEGVEAAAVGDVASATARFEEALEIDSEFVPALLGVAVIRLREGDYEAAAAAVDEALAIDPGSLDALGLRLEVFWALGDEEGKRTALEALLEADPAAAAPRLLDSGTELFNAGDVEGAREIFLKVLEVDPDNPRAHYKIGVCYASARDTGKAREHLERFLELAPDDPDAATAREMLEYLD